jgi:hypothetical protein
VIQGVGLVVIALCCVLAGLAMWRTLTLFHVSVRDGELLVVYGRIPAALLSELEEIVHLDRIANGTIKAVKEGGEARIVCSGEIGERTAQRVRNVCGPFPIAKLRRARPIANPTLGQRLGIEWLAWRQKL